jgi:hypothetical protein
VTPGSRPLGARSTGEASRRVVYYDHAAAHRAQPPFRAGEASSVELAEDAEAVTRARVEIPPNSLHALYGHGVVAALSRLPLAIGPLAPGRDAVLRPAALSEASRILYEADRNTYGAIFEFAVEAGAGESGVAYRIAIDNREYQRTLSRLQYLVVLSGREGRAVRLRL